MQPRETPVPSQTLLKPERVAQAWFTESYRVPLTNPDLSITDLFEAILGHHPRWVKTLLLLRNRLAKRAGLAVPEAAAIEQFERKAHYGVGDTIGPWPIYALSATELIAGRDNPHLDFRFSILKLPGPAPELAISTVCNAHNLAGRYYLRVIVPFHRFGMRQLLRRAVSAGRL